MYVGDILFKTKIDNKDFSKQLGDARTQAERLEEALKTTKDMNAYKGQQEDVEQLELELEKAKNKVADLEKKQQKVNEQGFKEATKEVNKLGKSISKSITKIGKMALAVFGIRSAYSAVRSAMGTLSQYNEQLKTDIEYIRYALATTLKKPIEWLVSSVIKLLNYVNYLSRAWFGINLFENASVSSFKKTNSEAKKLSKTLSGFDEMNVLSDTSSGSADTTPSLDLSLGEDKDIPEWMVKVKEFGEWVIQNWEIVVYSLMAVGLVLWFVKLASATKEATGGVTNFTSFVDKLGTGLEVLLIVGSISILFMALNELLQTMADNGTSVWEVLGLLVAVITPLIVLMGAIALLGPAMSAGLVPFSVMVAELVIVMAALAITVPIVLDALADFTERVLPKIIDLIKTIWAIILNIPTFIVSLGKSIESFVGSVMRSITKLVNFVVEAIEYMVNAIVIDGVNAIINGINSIGKYVGFTVPTIPDFQLRKFTPTYLAKGGVVNMPSKGVPVGTSAMAGESGKEGVIPLTDEQQMELLGQTIGKYVNFNATIPVYVGNRQIAREIKKIDLQNGFAMNS